MHAPRLLPLTLALMASLTPLATEARRALTPEDWYRFQAVSDLKIAPDGAAVAYLVTSYDKATDESRAALWTVDWAGHHGEQLTQGESVSEPRFSPDGTEILFASNRGTRPGLWVVSPAGEGTFLRAIAYDDSLPASPAWSPDGTKIVVSSTRLGFGRCLWVLSNVP